MVAARIAAPHTKLATTRWWHTSTLAEDFGVTEANENDLYAAMDWLLARGLGGDQRGKAQTLHGRGHRLHVAVSARACHLERLAQRHEGLALE